MIEVENLLFDITGDDRALKPGVDLIAEGILDSFTMIEFFTALEDEYGVVIHPTRVDRSLLHTADGIRRIIDGYINERKQKT